MIKPGCAPLPPAVLEPVCVPAGSCVASSPKYQTLPWSSCPYQSKVSSVRTPASKTWSRTSIVFTPSIVFVVRVTVTVSTTGVFWTAPLYVNLVPGTTGKYGLLIVVDLWKLAESKAGQVGAGLDPGPFAPTACVSGPTRNRLRIVPPKASGRRILFISSPSFLRGRATLPPEDESTMNAHRPGNRHSPCFVEHSMKWMSRPQAL